MGKVHIGDLLRIGHMLWYRVGCGPGMPGPYRETEGNVGDSGRVRGRHVCRPYGWAVWWVAAARVTAGENICLRNVRKSFILIL